MVRLALLALVAVLAVPGPEQTLNVWSADAIEPGVRRLANDFRRETGHQLAVTFLPASEIERRIASAEAPDVVIATSACVAGALRTGRIADGTQSEVARVRTGRQSVSYVAAVSSTARFRAAGLDFVRFLASPTARQVFAATGAE